MILCLSFLKLKFGLKLSNLIDGTLQKNVRETYWFSINLLGRAFQIKLGFTKGHICLVSYVNVY